jgi:hypothetical protein
VGSADLDEDEEKQGNWPPPSASRPAASRYQPLPGPCATERLLTGTARNWNGIILLEVAPKFGDKAFNCLLEANTGPGIMTIKKQIAATVFPSTPGHSIC